MITKIQFENKGLLTKECEGLPIIIDGRPIGVIIKISDDIVEGYIYNRYIGVEYDATIKDRESISSIIIGTFGEQKYE